MALDSLYGMGGGPGINSGINPSLQQLLLGLAGPSVGTAPQPTVSGMSPLDSQIEAQIRALSQPEPFSPVPVPNAPTTLQKVLASIADAAGVYAGGLNPYVGPPGALNMLGMQNQERQRAIRENSIGQSGAYYKGRQREAELKLRQLLGEKETQDTTTREEAKYKRGRADIVADREAEAKIDLEKLARQQKFQAEQQALRLRSEEAQARFREGTQRGDKYAKEQRDSLKEAIVGINTIANNVSDLLYDHPDPEDPRKIIRGMSPEEIRTKLRRDLVALGLGKDATDIALAYFGDEVEPTLQAAEYEGQGPEQESPEARAKKSKEERRAAEERFRMTQARRPIPLGPKD